LKKRLLLLNLTLVALIVLAGLRLRSTGESAAARERFVHRMVPAPAVSRPEAPLAPATPLVAGDYASVAQKMLFAQDRNPNVIVDAAPVKIMPPLPVAHGTMELGGVVMALLSEKPGAPHRAYMAGENIGVFKLISVSREELTLEWEGQKITRRLAELMEAGARAGSPGAASQPDAAPPANAGTTTIQNVTPGQPGIQTDTDTRACQPGDPSPDGTVSDGYRKVVQKTPFGNSCQWRAVR
jgi:hypothetical protein